MQWAAWEPEYRRILAEFQYDAARDEEARDVLDGLLADRLLADLGALRDAIHGREVVVLGGAAASGPLPDGPLLVADPRAVPPRAPLAVVTDLDGDISLQMALNAVGIPLVVHAHGDNIDALRAHVPRLRGPVLGTTQCAPRGRVRCFGGFTDGDRACCLAAELGASALVLAGFDFERPAAKPGRDPRTKRAKLAVARRIIGSLGLPTRTA